MVMRLTQLKQWSGQHLNDVYEESNLYSLPVEGGFNRYGSEGPGAEATRKATQAMQEYMDAMKNLVAAVMRVRPSLPL